MVEISEEVYMQERRWRRKPVKPANQENVRSQTERGKGLVNHACGNMRSLASTNTGRADNVTRWMVGQLQPGYRPRRSYSY